MKNSVTNNISNGLSNGNFLKIEKKEDEIFTLFELENKTYALSAKNVLEIIKLIEIDYPNKMPSCFLGLIEYNQSPIGVIDLREAFKIPRVRYKMNSKVIIYECKDRIISFVCDKIIDVKKLDKKKISYMPYQQEKFYDGLYINEDENIYILNPQNLLDYIENNSQIFEYEKNPSEFLPEEQEQKETLKKRRELLKNIDGATQNQKPLYDMGVSFKIDDIKYYINMANVREFFKVNNSKFIKVPNTPEYIFGLINIKGEYITVLDLRRFYTDKITTLKEKSTIIILNSQEYKLGLLADEILESMNIDFEEIIQNKIQKQDDTSKMEFVKNGEIYQIIELKQLLDDERLTIC